MGKLICASNCNDVLTDFLRTGVYDRNRSFHTTMSPSMDILVSSNLERLLFDLSGENDAEVRGYMEALAKDGKYEVSDAIKARLAEEYWGGSGQDRTILSGIAAYYEPEQLIGKDVLFVANFAPRKMMGIESQGMILSAVNFDGSLTVTGVQGDVKPGSQVG